MATGTPGSFVDRQSGFPIIRKSNPKTVNYDKVWSLARLQEEGQTSPHYLQLGESVFSKLDQMMANDAKRTSSLRWLMESWSSVVTGDKVMEKFVGFGDSIERITSDNMTKKSRMIGTNHFVWPVSDYDSVIRYIITKPPAKNLVNGNVATDGSGEFTFSFAYSNVSVDDTFVIPENGAMFLILQVNKLSMGDEVTVKARMKSDSFGNRAISHSFFEKGLEIIKIGNNKTEASIDGSSIDQKRAVGAYSQNWITTSSMQGKMTGHAFRTMSSTSNMSGKKDPKNMADCTVYEFETPKDFFGNDKIDGIRLRFSVTDLQMELMKQTKNMQINSLIFETPDMDKAGNWFKCKKTGYDMISGYGLLQQIGKHSDRPYSVMTMDLIFDTAMQMLQSMPDINNNMQFEFCCVMHPQMMQEVTRNMSKVFAANPIVFYNKEEVFAGREVKMLDTTINAYRQDQVTIYFKTDYHLLGPNRPIMRTDNYNKTAQDYEVHLFNVTKTYDSKGNMEMPFEILTTMNPIMGKLQGLTGEGGYNSNIATLEDSVQYRTLIDGGIACRSQQGMYIKFVKEPRKFWL